ncbi:MAG: bifunctional DNA primase/polymerase, partial [Candidatus Obscuribacterales bacterium]|nr:bifunctional DNA primase/polymerase [Candidatus Obscuribacterales bacterium]
ADFHVFPVDANNILKSMTLELASNHIDQITEWYSRHPEANLAVALLKSGHCAITVKDVDLDKFLSLWNVQELRCKCDCWLRFKRDPSVNLVKYHTKDCKSHYVIGEHWDKPHSPLLVLRDRFVFFFKTNPLYPFVPCKSYNSIDFISLETRAILVAPSLIDGEECAWAEGASLLDIAPPLIPSWLVNLLESKSLLEML